METAVFTSHSIFYKVVRYDIPVFQRPYVWTQEHQWEPLWEDVAELAETVMETGTAPSHFMGAIVLQQVSNPMAGIETRVIVDGQQRLTTVQLLIDAVQEFCAHRGFEESAERLLPLVQNPKAFLSGNPSLAFKIWPTEFDQEAFQHAMQNDLNAEDHKDNRIVMAHNYFKEQVGQWLDQSPQKEQRERAVGALEKAICHCLEFVVINLNASDNPHIIFETLNARGTPLLPSDQVKNHILYQANVGVGYEDEESSAEVSKLWGFNTDWWREDVGRGHQRRPRIDVFLNNWLTLRHGREVKANNEFQAFEGYLKKLEDDQSIWEVAEDLAGLGRIYQRIDECDYPGVETFLQRRRVMNAGAVMPTLLWLLSSDLPANELRKAITTLDSYLVRRMACGYSARSYAQLFIELAAELSKAGPDSAGDTVVQFLSGYTGIANKWPDDGELLEAFLNNPMYQWLTVGRLQLILQGIEGALRTPFTEIQALPVGLQIEHIMPQSWQQHWVLPSDMDEEEAITLRNRSLHTIGNLTLVTGRLNPKLSNAGWEAKREGLAEHSVLYLNKDIVNSGSHSWSEATISDRGRKLFEAAIRVWPYGDAIA